MTRDGPEGWSVCGEDRAPRQRLYQYGINAVIRRRLYTRSSHQDVARSPAPQGPQAPTLRPTSKGKGSINNCNYRL